MTLHAFLMQVGTLVALGAAALLSLRAINRRQRSAPTRPRRGGASLPDAPLPDTRLQTPILVDETWTPEQCAEVLERLTPGQEFQYFAADHHSPTDPGGHVRVQRSVEGSLIRKVANRGWSSFWERTDLAEVQRELYRNRAAQTVTVHQAILTQAYRQEAEGNR